MLLLFTRAENSFSFAFVDTNLCFSNMLGSFLVNLLFVSDFIGEDEEGEGIVLQGERSLYPWEGSDRDYTYEEVCLIYYCLICIVAYGSAKLLSFFFLYAMGCWINAQ